MNGATTPLAIAETDPGVAAGTTSSTTAIADTTGVLTPSAASTTTRRQLARGGDAGPALYTREEWNEMEAAADVAATEQSGRRLLKRYRRYSSSSSYRCACRPAIARAISTHPLPLKHLG